VVEFADALSPITERALPPTVTGAATGATTWLPDATPSVPLVVGALPPVPAAGAGAVPVDAPLEVLSPTTEMALPPTVTGAAIGATAWVPETAPSVPSVVGAEPAVGAAEPGAESAAGAVDEPVDELSPSTEMPFPLRVNGTAMGLMACVPDSSPSPPLVVAPEPAAGVAADVEPVVDALDELSPSTEIALPLTFTGTLTGADTCVPETAPFAPFVVADAGAEVVLVLDGAVPVAASFDSLFPATDTAFPLTVIGTVTETRAWVPDAVPLEPLVDAAGFGAAVCAGAEASLLDESPSTEMPLPEMFTGSVMSSSACVPDAVPSSPDVSAACAATVLKRAIPPPTSTPRSARFMMRFIALLPD
jgi:hypothetical protein